VSPKTPTPIHELSRFETIGDALIAGVFGTQIARGISAYMERHGETEWKVAYAALVEQGSIIEIAPQEETKE